MALPPKIPPPFMQRFGQGLEANPNMLMGIAQTLLQHRQNATSPINFEAALLGGQVDMRNKREKREEQRVAQQENATRNLFRKFRDEGKVPQIDDMTLDQLPAGELMGWITEATKPKEPATTNDIINWNAARETGYTGGLQDWIKEAKSSGGNKFYGTPVWTKDENNQDVLGQLGEDGQFHRVDTGGLIPQPPVTMVNQGTQIVPVQTRGGTQAGPAFAVDNAGKARDEKLGEMAGNQAAAAPGQIAAADEALKQLNEIRTHPGRGLGTGTTSYGNWIPGSPGRGFQSRVDQAKAGAFLTAIQQLKGLGALSNAEGQTATAAVTRMDTATSEAEFLDALDDYEAIVTAAKQKAQGLTGATGVPSAPAAGSMKQKYGLE